MIAKYTRHFVIGHNAETDFVRYQNCAASQFFKGGSETGGLHRNIARSSHQITQPERQAVNHYSTSRLAMSLERRDQIERLLDSPPTGTSARLMFCNARGHFGIVCLGGGNIGARALIGRK